MKEDTKKFLELFFNSQEQICVQKDKYAYHSVKQADLDSKIPMVSSNQKMKPFDITENEISLVAINPITGFRNDRSVTSFRSFLFEIDDGSLIEQKKYIEESELPYSICIFSGNKSLHYGVVLDSDLLNIQVWRHINQWVLNILTRVDQQTKNPSRGIRFPGHKRRDGKQLIQSLIDIRGRVSQNELFSWLNKFPDKKPKKEVVRLQDPDFIPEPIIAKLPNYFHEMTLRLRDGDQPNRNSSWFHVACIMAKNNFQVEDMVSYLDNFFNEESDFKRSEWLSCIKSAFKKGSSNV